MAQRIDGAGGQVRCVQPRQVGRRQPQVRRAVGAEDALVADVVDGEQRAGGGEQRLVLEDGAQQQRGEGGVPVIAVHDARCPAHLATGHEGRAREGDEAQVFVRIAGVEAGAREQRRAVDQVYRGASGQLAAQHREREPLRADAEPQLGQVRHRARRAGGAVDARIRRGEQAHIVSGTHQRLAERAGDIRQAPGLGQGSHLGGEHAHRVALLWSHSCALAAKVMMARCDGY